MEILLPVIALGGLYIINKQTNEKENFENKKHILPNENIPNRNYWPDEFPVEPTDIDEAQTSFLSKNNRYGGGLGETVYTDKYFAKKHPQTNNQHPQTNNQHPQTNNQHPQTNNQQPQTNNQQKFISLTGEEVDSDYFTHNNQVPYFGSKLKNNHLDATSNEALLDAKNGGGSQINSKKEQSPLFTPGNSLQWANGAPSASDFIQSRVNPSMRMANTKPFEEERVGPGLGLGYTTDGSGGFNSGMNMRESWLDRGVDELRVANKQKASGIGMLGHEGPANSMIKNTGMIGNVEKYNPDSFFEMDQSRYFTTTGVEKGPTLHGIPVYHPQSRNECNMTYSGVASGQNPSTYINGEYMPSHNQSLNPYPIMSANAVGRNYATEEDYGYKTNFAYPNNRTQNTQDEYYGIVGGVVGAVVAPLLDALKPSRKENTINSLRPYQNPKSEIPKSYLFNPDQLNTTIRETTENISYMNVENQHKGGAYTVTEVQPINNSRMNTGDYYYAGGSSAGSRTQQPRTYDAEYNQHNNDIKSSTIRGYMVKGNMNIFNSNIKMTNSSAKDDILVNDRDVVPNMPIHTPNVSSMGKLQGANNYLQNLDDRNTSDLLDNLKNNPYALNITNGI
jgi:hypothetical protein